MQTFHFRPTPCPYARALCAILLTASISFLGLPCLFGTASAGAAAIGSSEIAKSAASPSRAAVIRNLAKAAMNKYHLRALIVRATSNGKNLYTGAMGESMSGVPATASMHFRNGSMAFTYIGEIFAQLVDHKKVSLNDRLSKWMPQLPSANKVTIKNLLNMTSGYADYVYQPAVLDGVYLDPFRQWTDKELINIGVSAPMQFQPGTNWAYSHTNYVILGRLLAMITGKPLSAVMQQYIFTPMGLHNTSDNHNTPAIPSPVLHSFTSERRETLKIPPSVPFTEDSTFWNPSWTTASGAVQTTNIYDMTKSMTMVGDGRLVSPQMYKVQVGNNLAGFGHSDPSCPACAHLTKAHSYGLGVVLLGPWITQTKNFAGNGATTGYLPSKKLTITVVTTYLPQAFDSVGNSKNASTSIFDTLANALAPGQAPSGS